MKNENAEQPAQDDPDLQDKDPELVEQPAQQEPVADEVRCPECGYLTKHTEHIGCLRKQLNAINDFEQRNFAIVNMDKFPPAQRKPLTEYEIEDLYFDKFSMGELKAFARAIEAAHGIKENA